MLLELINETNFKMITSEMDHEHVRQQEIFLERHESNKIKYEETSKSYEDLVGSRKLEIA